LTLEPQPPDSPHEDSLTRRQWLSRAPLTALAATAGLAAFSGPSFAAPAKSAPKSEPDLGAHVYNIRDFGAKGDGTTLDTAALQSAIDACNRDGGGTVLVPTGTFVIGTTELKSNVTLHIAASGKLLGTTNGKQYHAVDAIPLHGDTTLNDGNWALLFAVNAKNVTLEGPGTIDGNGPAFHSPVRGTPPPSGIGGNKRPYHILAYRCTNLSVRNIDLLDCAYHSIRVIQSQRVHMDTIYIHSRVNSNNDGFHFISAEYVTISNCCIKCGDDACALFGSCKYITVTNSLFSTRWSVFRFGGGHAENVTVSNCLITDVFGCPIKFQGDPGSVFENMSFSNLVLDNVTGPISISVGGHLPAPGDKQPVIVRNIAFSNIHGTVTTSPPEHVPESTVLGTGNNPGEKHSCIVLNSVNDSVLENISFDNVHLVFGGGGTAEEAAVRDVPKIFGEYFRLGAMPAYGLYARNVRGITMNNVRLQVASPELRPAIILDHVEDFAVNGLGVEGNPHAESVLRFIDSKHALITAARVLNPSPTFLQLEGADNSGIIVDGGDLSRATSPVTYKNGATESAVKLRT
jgi:polygalacturonase